jgi:hypothetical protein
LDPKGFVKGTQQTNAALAKTREGAIKEGKQVERQGIKNARHCFLLGLKFRASQDRVPPAVGRLAFQLMCTTGMVGYPRYTASGIEVTTMWNPNFLYGGSIQVESDLTPACGTWYIVNIAHECTTCRWASRFPTHVQCSRCTKCHKRASGRFQPVWSEPMASVNGGAVKVSKSTGMVGYPRYTASGIEVTTIHKPKLRWWRLRARWDPRLPHDVLDGL